MFEDVGKKLMGLSRFLCWAGIIYCQIHGIKLIEAGGGLRGFAAMVVGPMLCWAVCWVFYALGKITDKAEAAEKLTKPETRKA